MGCAGRQDPGPLVGQQFDLTGKIGVRGAGQSFSARFRWQQADERYRIELWGPLGQGRTLLNGDLTGIEIADASGAVIDRGEIRGVMERQLGWYLPLEAMPVWVQGQLLAGAPVSGLERDAAGRLASFEQLGWRLAIDRAADGQPKRLTAEDGVYRVRIVL